MRIRFADLVTFVAMVFIAFFTLAHYDELPARVATHFDLHGVANGWMPRAWAAFFAPGLAVLTFALVRFLPSILPRREKARVSDGTVALLACITTVFIAAVHVVMLRVTLVPGVSIVHSIWLLMGGLFVALGLVLPRVGRNAFIGFRTPWALASDENWARTQRFAGYSMIVTGVVTAALGSFGGVVSSVLAIVALMLGTLVPFVYSLRIARREG